MTGSRTLHNGSEIEGRWRTQKACYFFIGHPSREYHTSIDFQLLRSGGARTFSKDNQLDFLAVQATVGFSQCCSVYARPVALRKFRPR
jgi:hypothetical protein